MDRKQVLEELRVILQKDIFENNELDISELTTSEDIEGWDSFEQINILTAIEEKYNIRFNVQKAKKIKTIKGLIDYICEACG
ncbi:MAG: acyl carrier protein [Butyrivibrio sp.]